MTDNQIFSLLKKIYPLSLFNEKDYQALVNSCERIRVVENEPILETGKPWNGLYLILDGKIQFMVEMSGQLVPYNQLYTTQHFGSLTSETPVNFSVYGAADSTKLLLIPKQHFQTYLKRVPQLGQLIQEYQTQQTLKDFLIKTPMFEYVPTQQLQSMVSRLKTRKLLPNEILIRQGDKGNEAYIIEKGNLVVRLDERPNKVLSTLIPGDLVGEIALIKNTKRTTNVIAQTEASVFVLPKQEFMMLFTEQGHLNEWLNQLVQERLETPHLDLKAKSHAKDYKTWLKDRLGLFPVVSQNKPQDSGAACIAMICRYYGKPVDLNWIRSKITANQMAANQDATLSDLSQAAEKMGLLPLAVLSSYEHLKTSGLPVIVGWKGEHWAVVYQITEEKVSIVEPAFGNAQKISKDIFLNNWIFSTLYLKPTERFFGRI